MSAARPTARPIIGIPASTGTQFDRPAHMVLDQYIEAVTGITGASPRILPALGDRLSPSDLLAGLDGLMVPGDRSNVAPRHYGGSPAPPGEIEDPARDATVLALIPAAIAAGVPLLGICRGLQEMNVALGGTLHSRVHLVDGLMDHRAPTELPDETRFAPVHEIRFTPGGRLAALVGAAAGTGTAMVNSLHGQGIERLAERLAVEATSPDGLVEAISVEGAAAFAIGLQWHPEWRAADNALSRAVFTAFAQAVANHAAGQTRASH
jgi:putative glutamine amidotransferase